ncbi:MAG: TIGR01777 family oxidoreductase [Propionibacteriaceae bacterium]|jgi:uncharacterized protein (TIGR01777 family)|nr:TIGR01777 family oxidoreductase [Propionibacteriaceae bacterium]
MKILLAGASGMIGTALKGELSRRGDAVRVLARDDSGDYRWDGRAVEPAPVEWADAVVSLSGASLTKLPWTSAYRRLILTSRVDATAALARAITGAPSPPRVWVSGSAVGIYGDRGDAELDESATGGTGFLADVVRAWEGATAAAQGTTRVVNARTGIVLGAAGALAPLVRTTRLGLGARIGPGTQWWGWVSLEDEVRAITFALDHEELAGPVNLVGPVPATASTITRAVAAALRRPHRLVIPAWAIRLAMGAASELLLDSQRVRSGKLLAAGYEFRHQTPDSALAALGLA